MVEEASPIKTTGDLPLCGRYDTLNGVYDEMCSRDSCVRLHWQSFVREIDTLTPQELRHRQSEIRRLLRENGVTYNVHGDPEGLNRPWELDLVPMIIADVEWGALESGLSQRALLLDMIFEDLYGSRRLIREGLLPPELVYAHEGFLRPCDGIRHPGNQQIGLYAVDLARGPDRRFWVVNDRLQSPAGAGYALENRMAMLRIFPDLIRDSHVRRLSRFFGTLRTALVDVAPRNTENPRIGVLTPGQDHETYFEQAYLASYLGFTLVQGDDLLVRDGTVWLKSLDGLKPMDVLLRWVDDLLCDPLELRHDSLLGVAGLLEAMRRLNVTVINPPGCSVLENPGMLPFLPGIGRFFLQQDLQLPAPATWWCGQPDALEYVVEHLDELVIKGIDSRVPVPGDGCGDLDREGQGEWKARIRAAPHLYVGQEKAHFATAPTLIDGRLQPRHEVLRTFMTSDGESYAVMPGGLTLGAPEPGYLQESVERGNVSKDTWVLAAEPQEHVSLWLQPDRVEKRIKSGSVLPSRAAENLFWVGRYAERAEGVIRLLRTVLRSMIQSDRLKESADTEYLQQLLHALATLTDLVPQPSNGDLPPRQSLRVENLPAVISDLEHTGSLAATFRNMLQAAVSVRHLWSVDSWRVINHIEEQWKQIQRITRLNLRWFNNQLDGLVSAMMAFAGLNSESMTREQGWLLLDIGRRIERASFLCTLIGNTLIIRHPPAVEYLLLEAVLTTTENIITYRHRYRSYLHLQTVLDLVLLDGTNPRSLIYQINRLQKHITHLPRDRVDHRLSEDERFVLEASGSLRLSDLARLADGGLNPQSYAELDMLLLKIGDRLSNTSEALTRAYFSHAPVSRRLSQLKPETVR